MAKRVVVTGASSGIGDATARLFREHDWDVVAIARRGERLETLASETGVHPIAGDVTDQADVDRIRNEIAALGPVDALINNAGGAFGSASVEHGDPEDWRAMFDVNVLGTKRMISAMLPLLRDGARAHGVADILSITSVAGHEVYENGAGYNAAKFAEHALMAVLRLELAGEPIRVLELAPGRVRTEGIAITRIKADKEKADAVYAGVDDPLVAADIARIIVQTIELPAHINLDLVTVRPVAQAAAHKVIRQPLVPKD
jgi:NADP-dependent 3-hydroxy acid dehydrogenase YdfG